MVKLIELEMVSKGGFLSYSGIVCTHTQRMKIVLLITESYVE